MTASKRGFKEPNIGALRRFSYDYGILGRAHHPEVYRTALSVSGSKIRRQEAADGKVVIGDYETMYAERRPVMAAGLELAARIAEWLPARLTDNRIDRVLTTTSDLLNLTELGARDVSRLFRPLLADTDEGTAARKIELPDDPITFSLEAGRIMGGLEKTLRERPDAELEAVIQRSWEQWFDRLSVWLEKGKLDYEVSLEDLILAPQQRGPWQYWYVSPERMTFLASSRLLLAALQSGHTFPRDPVPEWVAVAMLARLNLEGWLDRFGELATEAATQDMIAAARSRMHRRGAAVVVIRNGSPLENAWRQRPPLGCLVLTHKDLNRLASHDSRLQTLIETEPDLTLAAERTMRDFFVRLWLKLLGLFGVSGARLAQQWMRFDSAFAGLNVARKQATLYQISWSARDVMAPAVVRLSGKTVLDDLERLAKARSTPHSKQ